MTIMMENVAKYLAALCLAACVGACHQEPDKLPPTVTTLGATDVTRISATLHGLIQGNGGAVTRSQFRYGLTPDLPHVATVRPAEGEVAATVDGLQHGSTYYYQLEAGDDYWLERGGVLTFETVKRTDSGSIWVEQPGTLAQLFSEQEAYNVDTLLLSGRLNGDDLRFLRQMLGRDVEGNMTPGRVSVLDMTDVLIVSGGEAFDGQRFAATDTIVKGLFADCVRLRDLRLPARTKAVEAEAFRGCIALEALALPGGIQSVEPSSGCTSLQRIEMAGNNEYYQSDGGVLFDKERRTLVWFPAGRTADYALPSGVTTVGAAAFADSQCSRVVLTDEVRRIGMGAFARSAIEVQVLPDGLENVERGTFQGCSRLVSLTLGSETLFLSDHVVDGCPLTELHVRAAEFVPHCEEATFSGAGDLFGSCTLYVPRGCKSRYSNNRSWGRFERIVEE